LKKSLMVLVETPWRPKLSAFSSIFFRFSCTAGTQKLEHDSQTGEKKLDVHLVQLLSKPT
jgi:hypothetical protein